MDFPDNAATNVYRVDGINEIYWDLYTSNGQDIEKPANHANKSLDEEDLLPEFVYDLRREGRHVWSDAEARQIWVFNLLQSNARVDHPSMSSHGLDKLSTGTLRAADLVNDISPSASVFTLPKAAPISQSSLGNAGASRGKSTRGNASFSQPPQTSSAEQAAPSSYAISCTDNVYDKAMAAVSCTLSQFLANNSDWLPLGSGTCVNCRTLGDTPSDQMWPDPPTAKTTTVTYKVSWTTLGTLTVTTILTNVPKLCRVETVLSKLSSVPDSGTPVLLSPSGIEVLYGRAERKLTRQSETSATNDVKELTLARLARQGIDVAKDGGWTLVHVPRQTKESEDFLLEGQKVAYLQILWPAQLILHRDIASKGELGVKRNLFTAIDDDLNNPLARVESWFLGKSARVEALAAKQQQDENVTTPKAKESGGSEDELDMSGTMSPMNRYIASQDISGIYPTPPDGLRSQGLDLVANNEHQNTSSDNESRNNVDNADIDVEYSDQADQDMFGNMDMDMFTENDLTEADFNFFDEPGIEEEDDTNADQILMTDEAFPGEGLEQTKEDSPRFGTREFSHGSSEQDSKVRVQTFAKDPPGPGETMLQYPRDLDISTLSQLPRKETTKSRENTLTPLIKEDIDVGASDRPLVKASLPREELERRQRSSFVPMLRRELDFDSKYRTEGRFGSQSENLKDLENLEQALKPLRKTIPQIGIQEDNLSAIDGEIDTEDDSDDQQSFSSQDDNSASSVIKMDALTSQKEHSDKGGNLRHPATPLSPVSAQDSPMNDFLCALNMPTSVIFARTKYSPLEGFKNMSHNLNNFAFATKDIPFIEVAQLVADQVVLGAPSTSVSESTWTNLYEQLDSRQTQTSQDVIAAVISSVFPSCRNCSLSEHSKPINEKVDGTLTGRDTVLQGQRIRDTAQSSDSSDRSKESIFSLPAPFMSVRRIQTATDIMASALPFWEELSLWPSCGPKDVNAFCVCPENRSIRAPVINFLSMMKGTYQACNLGNHAIGCDLEDYPDGVVPVNASGKTAIKTLLSMESACEKFGILLAEKGLWGGNTIVYMLNYFNRDEALPGLCAAFSTIFRGYKASLKNKNIDRPNDLVLQVVDLSFVFSTDKIVNPSPTDCKRLAFQVFDRCGPCKGDDGAKLPFMSAPAIRLAMPVPKAIDFKLTSNSTEKLLSGEKRLHIAYSWASGQQWLTASWTDSLGVLQWNAAYWLGKDERETWQPFARVANEIWETTLEMMQPQSNPWKLFIVKDSPISIEELDIWLPLFAGVEKPSTSCTLLTITENPILAFPLPYTSTARPDSASESPVTPTSTPYITSFSPEVLAHVSTPGWDTAQASTPGPNMGLGDPDEAARLIDITNETWGLCTHHNFDFPTTPSVLCTVQASGYLVKRAGPRDEDGLLPVGIDIMYPRKLPGSLLEEVLSMYRNLALLARVRRLVDPMKGVLPWHVAAARKAHEILTTTMRYDGD